METNLNFMTAFHPTIKWSIRTNNSDNRRYYEGLYFLFKENWEDHLPLVKLAYNNSYHPTICKALKFYMVVSVGHRFVEIGEKKLINLDLVQQTTTKLSLVRKNEKSL